MSEPFPQRREGRSHWLGLMSGTSCDGIDVARVAIEESAEQPKVVSVEGCTVPFERAFAHELRDRLSGTGSFAEAARADARLGDRFAEAALHALATWGPVDGIALSGHTYSHLPAEVPPTTLQLGSAFRVAERTGTPVLSAFRLADVARGGEGAPLVPAGDRVLFGSLAPRVAVINIGGISNVTWLEQGRDPSACDAGPGNLLLDKICRAADPEGPGFDVDGARAVEGAVDEAWVEAHRVTLSARRTFGREEFGEEWWVTERRALERLELADQLATVCGWIAAEIAATIDRLGERTPPDRLLVGGGGARNRRLILELTARVGLPAEPLTATTHGVDLDLREAASFAILCHEWVYGRPSSFPTTTGARALPHLGAWSIPGAPSPSLI